MELQLEMRSYMDPVTENATVGLHAGLCWNILDKCLTRTLNNSPFHAPHHHGSSCSCAWVRENMQRLRWVDRAQADPPLFSPDYNYSSNGDGEGRKTFSLQLPSVLKESNSEIMFLISISMAWPIPCVALCSPSQRSHFIDYLQKQTSEGIGAYAYVYARSPPPLSTSTSMSIVTPTEAEAERDINRDGDGDAREGQEDQDLHARDGQEDQDDDMPLPLPFDLHMPLDLDDNDWHMPSDLDDNDNNLLDEEEEENPIAYPPSPPLYSDTNRERRPPLAPVEEEDEEEEEIEGEVDDDPTTAARPFKLRRLR